LLALLKSSDLKLVMSLGDEHRMGGTAEFTQRLKTAQLCLGLTVESLGWH